MTKGVWPVDGGVGRSAIEVCHWTVSPGWGDAGGDAEGCRTLNEGDQLAGAATDAAEGAGETLRILGDGRAGGGADAGETLGGLVGELGGLSSSLLSGLGSLLGGGRLEADGTAAEGEGRAPGHKGE